MIQSGKVIGPLNIPGQYENGMSPENLYRILCVIRQRRPLIHCISNIVTVNFCANGLLAIGASPVMAHHPAEVEEITSGADALVCNMGALEDYEAMKKAIKRASDLKHPVVIDPVGVAASTYRREMLHELMQVSKPTCIRGNVSEILAIIENRSFARGVDASASIDNKMDLIAKMQEYAGKHEMIMIASGKEDIVTDGKDTFLVANGDPLMASITGSGCLSGVILGAFLAMDEGGFGNAEKATLAVAAIGIAGQKAAGLTRQREGGIMTFETAFLDCLSLLNENDCELIDVKKANA